MRVPTYIGYFRNEEFTPHTQTQQYTTTWQNHMHMTTTTPIRNMHATTTTTTTTTIKRKKLPFSLNAATSIKKTG